MERLTQVLRKKDKTGEPLPDFLPALHDAGVRFRRAQVCLIVGRAGSGKSLLSLFAALRTRVRTLYVSADTDSKTMMWRAAASLMSLPVKEIEGMTGTSAEIEVSEALDEVDRYLAFDFTSRPTLDDIRLEVDAAEEAWGAYPAMIVIDNLMNVVTDGDTFGGWSNAMAEFHEMARATGAAVLVLHHASLNRSKEDEVAGMSAILGQVSALPEMILSVMLQPDTKTFEIGVIKNRHDEARSSGARRITLPIEPSLMTLYNDESERRMAEKRAEWT